MIQTVCGREFKPDDRRAKRDWPAVTCQRCLMASLADNTAIKAAR